MKRSIRNRGYLTVHQLPQRDKQVGQCIQSARHRQKTSKLHWQIALSGQLSPTHWHAHTRALTHTHCHTHEVIKLRSLATCLALVPLVSPQSMRKSTGKNCRHYVYVTWYPDSLCIYPQYISTRLCMCKSVCVSLSHIANNSRRNNRQRKHLTTNWKPTPTRAAARARARVGSMRANDETSLKQQ